MNILNRARSQQCRVQDTYDGAHHETLNQLSHCYDFSFSDQDKDGFGRYLVEFYEQLDAKPFITEQHLIGILYEFLQSGPDYQKSIRAQMQGAVMCASYFCYMSNQSNHTEAYGEAWFYLNKANIWIGTWYGLYDKKDIFNEQKQNFSRTGGKNRSKKYQPLRDFVLSEVKKRNYQSKRNAALLLKDEVLKLAKELKIGLSEHQAEKTISGWL